MIGLNKTNSPSPPAARAPPRRFRFPPRAWPSRPRRAAPVVALDLRMMRMFDRALFPPQQLIHAHHDLLFGFDRPLYRTGLLDLRLAQSRFSMARNMPPSESIFSM